MYGHKKTESIPTLKSEVLLIRTKCKSAAWKTKYALAVFSQVLLIKWTRLTDHCYGPWPWGKWAGIPVRKSKCARTQMIGWLGTRVGPTACSSEFASPYQSLAAWGSAALRGPMTRLPAFTCDYKRLRTLYSWDTMFLDWLGFSVVVLPEQPLNAFLLVWLVFICVCLCESCFVLFKLPSGML